MKNITTIILLFTTTFSRAQFANWVTKPDELGVVNYIIQSSSDSTAGWKDIATFKPQRLKDTNFYSFPIPLTNIYYRVAADMGKNFYYTSARLAMMPLSVQITNLSIQNNIFRWTSSNESNILYYIIEQSRDGVNWIQEQIVYPQGDGDYKITVKKKNYRAIRLTLYDIEVNETVFPELPM